MAGSAVSLSGSKRGQRSISISSAVSLLDDNVLLFQAKIYLFLSTMRGGLESQSQRGQDPHSDL